jgi:hypothetical protein
MDYVSQVNIGVGLGILLHISAMIIASSRGSMVIGLLLLLLGLLFFLWGCAAYAKNKGYSEFLGLLGLLGLIGLLVLVFLPHRTS